MAGIHLWRTGATGAWSWTFLRPKGNPYDDFDGTTQREHKDACIAYPTPDGKALVTTLQWEAIREGVDDYRYLYTLSKALKQAEQSGNVQARKLAITIESNLREMLTKTPWTCRNGEFTNQDADTTRQQVVQWILRLHQTLRK